MKKIAVFTNLLLVAAVQLIAQDSALVFNNLYGFENFKDLNININIDSIRKSVQETLSNVDFAAITDSYRNFGQSYQSGNNESAPTRVETRTYSNISAIAISNKYGNITVKESSGKQVEVEIHYFDGYNRQATCDISTSGGNLTVSSNNSGAFPRIDYIISAPKNVSFSVNLKYGSFSAESLKNLNTETSSYSSFTVKNAENVAVSGKYNTCIIDNATVINGETKYSTVKVKNLQTKLDLTAVYSNIKVENTSSKVQEIVIAGRYCEILLVLPANLSASFSVSLHYGKLNFDKKFKVNYTSNSIAKNNTSKIGQIGTDKPTARITLANTYADINIK